MTVNLLLTFMLCMFNLNHICEGKKISKEDLLQPITNESYETTSVEFHMQNKTNEITNKETYLMDIRRERLNFEIKGLIVNKTTGNSCSTSKLITIEVNAGEKYSFKHHKMITKCKTLFIAATGVTLLFRCLKFEQLNCPSDFLKVRIRTQKTYRVYCKDKPEQQKHIKKIQLNYMISQKNHSTFRCIIVGQKELATTTSLTTTSTTKTSTATLPSVQICPNYNCQQNENRILGGSYTTIEDFPHLALLRIFPDEMYCGGSVINQRFILTAGLCIGNADVALLEIYLGITEPSDFNLNLTTPMKAESIIIYPDYKFVLSSVTPDNIALVKLDTDIIFSAKIQPICIAEAADDNYVDEIAVVTGFGITLEQTKGLNTIHKISTKIYPELDCTSAYNSYGYLIDFSRELCASNGNTKIGPCFFDDGDPLIVYINGISYQLGVANVAYLSCLDGKEHQQLYTRVNYYLDWIKQEIGSVGC